MTTQDRAESVVMVRCAECLRRHGAKTRIGEMCLMPANLGGRWGWAAIGRWKIDDEVDGRRRWAMQVRSELKFSGGAEVKCHRCGKPRRFSVKRLAELAEDARARSVGDVYA